MNKKDVVESWKDWVNRQESDKFVLNSDEGVVEDIAVGILDNEVKKGFKYCPCRLPKGNSVEDVGLICPCNFKIQETWKEKGECWCSLFVREGKKEVKV